MTITTTPRRLPPLYEEPRLPRPWELTVLVVTLGVLVLMVAEPLTGTCSSTFWRAWSSCGTGCAFCGTTPGSSSAACPSRLFTSRASGG